MDGKLHPNVLVEMKWWHWAGRDATSNGIWHCLPKAGTELPRQESRHSMGFCSAQTHLSPPEQPQNPHLDFTTSATCNLQQQRGRMRRMLLWQDWTVPTVVHQL